MERDTNMKTPEESLIDQQKEKLDKILKIATDEAEQMGDNETRFRALKRIMQVINGNKYL